MRIESRRIINLKRLNEFNGLLQLLILVVLFSTLIIGGRSLFHHGKYYRNSIRPYIKCLPVSGDTKVVDGLIQWNYTISNEGETPAYDLIHFSMVTLEDTFPIEGFRKALIQTTAPAKGVIYRGDSFGQQKESKVMSANVENEGNDPVGMVLPGKTKIFFHLYFEYFDVNRKKYYLRSTYMLTYKEMPDSTQKESWKSINASEKLIRKTNILLHFIKKLPRIFFWGAIELAISE